MATKEKTLMDLLGRCHHYKTIFPKFPAPVVGSDDRIQGIWILGNDYRSKSGYYGSYPPNYLKRIYALFPDVVKNPEAKILHLFSGSVSNTQIEASETTFDLKKIIHLLTGDNVHPDVTGNAEHLGRYFKPNTFHLILADPPYSEEDAKKYGTALISRNKVLKEAFKILRPGGFLIWLDQVLPMYRKIEFRIIGVIGVVRSTNHRFRCVVIFQKLITQKDGVETK